jgi:hypothetical protein
MNILKDLKIIKYKYVKNGTRLLLKHKVKLFLK